MSDFVHLHLHSEYSLLDGACRIEDIPKRAAECGHSAVAITDHGVMYGAVAFYRACKNNGIKPIIGCEVYVAAKSMYKRSVDIENKTDHLVLLCKNEVGYKNLIYLVSKGFTDGFYSKPRIDIDLLRSHSEGLIALSACLAGRIPRLLSAGDFEGAVKFAKQMSGIFGKDGFYIELQNHGTEEERRLIPFLVKLAEVCELPLVATNDCHYLRRRDADTQAVLMCIQTNSVITDGRPLGFETNEFYYKDTDEMVSLFGRYEGAIENTVKIAEMCSFDFDFDKIFLPKFPCPAGISADEHLAALVKAGLKRRISDGTISLANHSEGEYEDRIAYELSVISKMGYSDYFLIVQDYVNYARSHDIPVGPGRGSGAGSLVAFVVGITDIDPIEFDLIFERFLNPERVSMPDIDVDFCYIRRDEVIKYVGEKYGSEHVSQIITFGTLAAKAAIRDVGRAMGMSYSDVDAVAKCVPKEFDITIEQALKLPALKELYDGSANVRKLVDAAMALEGMPRNVSIHAAGVVITDLPISDYVPLSQSNGITVTQYDMNTIAALGLLKFDFLSLRNLTVIKDAEDQIRKINPDFDIQKIPLDDRETYEMLSSGNTLGVFQLESGGMRQMLMSLCPDCIEDIIAAISLYRPGPMDSIPKYIENKKDKSKISYATPLLKPILDPTYGCIVYQEQVMEIFRSVAGYTFGHADMVRRAMAKKHADEIQAERQGFISGAKANAVSESDAVALFEDMADFAKYAFNKSHAAAYSVVAYRIAYMKRHYAHEYMAALLTSVLGNMPKVAGYISECSKMSIKVLPPDINHSDVYFHVDKGNIRFGLLALKNIGKVFAEQIVKERFVREYDSFEDFVERMAKYDINKRQVETLIKAGVFDSLGVYRSRLLASYEKIIEAATSTNKGNLDGQLDMFSSADLSDFKVKYEYPDIPEYSPRELLLLEKESSGLYFSGNLLDGFSSHIKDLSVTEISVLSDEDETVADKTKVVCAGIIIGVTTKKTRNDERMAFLTLEDKFGSIECVVFPKAYARLSSVCHVDAAVAVSGEFSRRDDEVKILVSGITPLIENVKYEGIARREAERAEQARAHTAANTKHRLFLRVPDIECELAKKAANLVEIFEGSTEVMFYDCKTSKYCVYSHGADISDFFMNELISLLGKENVVYK